MDFTWWVQIIGGLGTPGTLIIFLCQQRIDKRKREKDDNERWIKACNLIEKEITHVKDGIDSNIKIIRDADPPYHSLIFNMDGYQSLLNSGLFSYLDIFTQDILKRLHMRIRLHNEILRQGNTFRENFFIDGIYADRIYEWHNAVRSYNIELHGIEQDLLKLIEKVPDLIKNEKSKIK
jgi:hypothetical protein